MDSEADDGLLTSLEAFLAVKPKEWDKGYAKELEALRPALLRLRVKLQRDLFEAREKLRMPNYKPDPKDKDTPRYTDLDRRTMLEAATADQQMKYELVFGYENLVKERIQMLNNVNWG